MAVFRFPNLVRLLTAALLGCFAVLGSSDPGQAQPRTGRKGEIKLDRMRFAVVQGAGTPWVVAEGDIVPGTAEAFRALSRRYNLQGAPVLIS